MVLEFTKYEIEESVATITLNRPMRMNAVNIGLMRELTQLIDDIGRGDTIRAMIITGTPHSPGRPCFSTGLDLKEMESAPPTFHLEMEGLMTKIEDLDRVTIAAIDGACTAFGLGLAECCDIRLVAETARIGDLTVKNLGGSTHGGLVNLVGMSNAKYLSFTGDLIDGKEAVRMGLAVKCFPSDKLMEGAKEIARKAAAMRPIAVKLSKAYYNWGWQMDTLHRNTHHGIRFANIVTALAGRDVAETAERYAAGKAALEKG